MGWARRWGSMYVCSYSRQMCVYISSWEVGEADLQSSEGVREGVDYGAVCTLVRDDRQEAEGAEMPKSGRIGEIRVR